MNQAVESIRQAELEAQKMERQASDKAEEIIRSAKERASNLAKDVSSKAKEQVLAKMEEEGRQEKTIMQLSMQQADQEIIALRSLAQEREPQAIQMILKELV